MKLKLIDSIKKLIEKYVLSGHARSVMLKKNIIISLSFKGVSILTSFLLVPLCIDYLDKFQYGIWLIIASFLNWFVLFELGLGAGLQNKLAEALNLGKIKLAKMYVSTTFVSVSFIVVIVSIIFFSLHSFIGWHKVFNVPVEMEDELSKVVLITFSFFFLQFILRLINFVLYADQKAGVSNTLGPLSSVLSLLVIFVISKTCSSSLLYLTIGFCASQLVVLIIANTYFFRKTYKDIKPSIRFFRKSVLSDLMGLGVNFFIIQVSGIFMLQATNIVIAQFYSPNEVTQFGITNRLFSVSFIVFQIITRPLWPAYTQAWTTGDMTWIKNMVKKIMKLWKIVAAATLLLLLVSPFVYDVWVGDKVQIPFVLSLAVAMHFLLFIYGNIFNVFINGIGKLKVQLVSLLIGALLYLPLVYVFKEYFNLGVESVVFAMIIANFYSYIIAPIQYKKLVSGTAKGIWDK